MNYNMISVNESKFSGKTTTEYPHSFHTGKLNQFVGFVTPSPLPPPTDGPFG